NSNWEHFDPGLATLVNRTITAKLVISFRCRLSQPYLFGLDTFWQQPHLPGYALGGFCFEGDLAIGVTYGRLIQSVAEAGFHLAQVQACLVGVHGPGSAQVFEAEVFQSGSFPGFLEPVADLEGCYRGGALLAFIGGAVEHMVVGFFSST